ncbi:MAG: HAD-IC family P-type ATPase, partial [Cytophagales bacterium]
FLVVALAVSAIPEGLPVALTVALSIATKRMAKRNVIVRRLNSVESLGSCTVIASDKTGTLTINEQTAKTIFLPNGNLYSISGQGYNGEGSVLDQHSNEIRFNSSLEIQQLCKIAALANEGELKFEDGLWQNHGDAMDVALLGMCFKLGINPVEMILQNPQVCLLPYESELKYSAAIFDNKDGYQLGMKGAVEMVMDHCSGMSLNGMVMPIDKEFILSKADEMAAQGYRVLAFAIGDYKYEDFSTEFARQHIEGLTLIGLVGFLDPLRPEAASAVEHCKHAGIKVLMVTGDHPETALTISKQCGIAKDGDRPVSGKELLDAKKKGEQDFNQLVYNHTVFARVTPSQKLEIVDSLIKKGEFVAVTGDGVNDAPALKRANIGIAMGSGTDVAKEVGSMIVTDDNFNSIVSGVEEGRFAFDNVRKVIYLLVSTGAAEIVLFLASVIADLPIPLLAVQLLWLNLVTNGIQDVSLAFEGGEPGAMSRPPRKPSEKIFNQLMVRQSLVSSIVMGSIVFGYWYYLIEVNQMKETHARDLILLLFVFLQNFHTFNVRSERTSIFRIPLSRNWLLFFGVLAAQGIHVLSMHIPLMQNVLQIEPITFNEWISVMVLAVPIVFAMEIFKFFNKD